jgi:hypothetical protein
MSDDREYRKWLKTFYAELKKIKKEVTKILKA